MQKAALRLLTSSLMLACAGGESPPGAEGAPRSAERSFAAPADGSNNATMEQTDCQVEAARQFYAQVSPGDYDYDPLPPDELLARSKLVVKGRVVDIVQSLPTGGLSSLAIGSALKVEIDHTYRGTVQPDVPAYVVLEWDPELGPYQFDVLRASIPDVEVTLFLVGSRNRASDAVEGGPVLQPTSPQGLVLASSCGVGQALVGERLFPTEVDSADALHAAMLALPADPCRSQCPLATIDDQCVEKPLDSFSAIDVTRSEWSETLCGAQADMTDAFPYLLEARCADGKRLLYRGTGHTIERRYYTASGEFIALETAGDGGQGPSCNGSAYWPERVACANAVVVRVDCGTGSFRVGDSVPL